MFGFGKKKKKEASAKYEDKGRARRDGFADSSLEQESRAANEEAGLVGPKSGAQRAYKKSSGAKAKKIDKLVMGAIVGVAVGSVVGVSINQKKEQGEVTETPKIAGQKKPKSYIGRFLKRLFRKKPKKTTKESQVAQSEYKKIPHEFE